MKKALIVVSIIAGLLLLGMTYIGARSLDKERIAELESEMFEVRAMRDSILTVVAYKDSLQNLIQQQVAIMSNEANRLRDNVAQLEGERKEQELNVRRLDSFEAQEAKFLDTFPELGTSAQATEVVRNGFPFTYIMLPMAATETFVINHQDAENYHAQRDTLLALDSLQIEVIALKDSLFVLEQEKSNAYRTGYDNAYARYEALNQEYIERLKQPPRVSLFPDKGTAIISGTIGAAVGVAVGAAASRIGNK